MALGCQYEQFAPANTYLQVLGAVAAMGSVLGRGETVVCAKRTGIETVMGQTLFLVRAMRFDPVAARLAETLSRASGAPVVFVCDETRGATDTGPYEKISVTPSRLTTLGIKGAPEDWGWFWGDLCYYAALAQFSQYEHYCLIESDVFFSDMAAAAFVENLNIRSEAALAVRLGPHAAPPRYSKGLAALGLDAKWGCIFPVSRVHRDVVRAMLKLRQRGIVQTPAARLNDEAILAGAVQEGNHSWAALNVVMPDLFSGDTFDTNPPHLYEPLVHRENEMRVFHPVVQFETVLQRIMNREKNYHRHRMRRVLKMADTQMAGQIETALRATEGT
jgi:hypothetical protein